jgi:deazaflavin-dependent oxidoreductase (nitroreductase family)
MPSDAALKFMNSAHRALITLSFGKFGRAFFGMPVVELTTTGAKSGLPRTCMLTSPYHDESGYVIVASRGGDDINPAWYHNLVAHPEVKASIGGGPARTMTATVLEPGERDRVWAEIAGKYKNYRGYQTKTSRVIPLVRLS